MNIAIAGTGYAGLSNAVLLAQHNQVVALINVGTSPIEDTELAHDLAHKPLQLKATLDITEPAQTHRVHHQLNVNFAPELRYDPALGRTLSKYSLY